MKKAAGLSIILILLISCKKDKQASIVGVWKETAIYSKLNSTGDYKWEEVLHGFSYFLTLRDDGTYSSFQCTPTDRGLYQYDHANQKITMQSIPVGSTVVFSVSALDNDHLILNYGTTSMGEYRVRFTRNRY